MKKYFYSLVIVIYLCVPVYISAQENRTNALGGLSIGIEDIDNSLNPWNFGNNPAWFLNDETESYLKISPTISNSWGDYHRRFDSEGNMFYGTAFDGVKTLGELGTFYGSTSYNYEVRRNYNRTLKYDTYGGEAFFFIDTTAGNFHYNGPKVNLLYSWQLMDDLYAGGSLSYQLMDGLKKVYTYAKTVYRDVGANFGLAYKISDDLIIGANYIFFDSQESIESADVNLLEVETFDYRGETFYVPDRGSSVTQKIRKKGFTISGQLAFQHSNDLHVALQTNYTPSNTKVLIPEGGFKEVEEGYSWFESFDVRIKSQYKAAEDILTGIYAAYFSDYSWSRHSHKNLLLWDWDIKNVEFGAGASYQVIPELVFGANYIFSLKNIDSSKYIDGRYADLKSYDHSAIFGIEYKVIENLVLRFGYNFQIKQYDIFYGGSDVINQAVTFGAGFPIYNSILIDTYVRYSSIAPKSTKNNSRSLLGAYVTLRLHSF